MFTIVSKNNEKITVVDSQDNKKTEIDINTIKILIHLVKFSNITIKENGKLEVKIKKEKAVSQDIIEIQFGVFDTLDIIKGKIKQINTTNSRIKVINNSNITDMSKLFKDCPNLESIDLSDFRTDNIIDMSEMFANCTNLKEIIFTDFDLKEVKNITNMFDNCNAEVKIA